MAGDMLLNNSQFQEFVRLTQEEFARLQPESPARAAALHAEAERVEGQRQGWLQSLGNPALPAALRTALEMQFAHADQRLHEISTELDGLVAASEQKSAAFDPRTVAAHLEHLSEILTGENASATNLMLSQHIAGIYCDRGGKVLVRTCKLGALGGALRLVPRTAPALPNPAEICSSEMRPRRRARLDVGAAIEDEDFVDSANQFAVDPERFGGLGPEWFTEDVFQVPRRRSWAEAHAQEVAQYRLTHSASMQATARHFGKTPPTIRKALQFAQQQHGLDAFGKGVSRPSKPYWARDAAKNVAQFYRDHACSLQQTAEHFGRCVATIKKALSFARCSNSLPDPPAPEE